MNIREWYVWRDGTPFEGPYTILDAGKRCLELDAEQPDRDWDVRRFILPRGDFECRACAGSGHFYNAVGEGFTPAPCGYCKGTGRVK